MTPKRKNSSDEIQLFDELAVAANLEDAPKTENDKSSSRNKEKILNKKTNEKAFIPEVVQTTQSGALKTS